MARKPRQESSAQYYHVMVRGINRDFFFKRDSEKQLFLELVKEQREDKLLELAAWCIMDNHVHMIVKAGIASMSKAIKIISVKFAARYNKAYERTGPVFGDRYRSESIEDDTYLLGVLRYIHLNPVKAGMTVSPSQYQWSSYGEYVNRAKHISQEQRVFILGMFGGNQERFVDFHARPDDTEYLEIPEDREKYRRELALSLLEAFCAEKHVTRAKQIHSNPELFAEICLRLTQGAKLSLRQVAEVLDTSHGRVHRALKDRE